MFITFEGIEGCGKTTQIKRLEQRLNRHDISVVRTHEPGGTRIGKHIRQILLDSRHEAISPLAELILYAADRAQHIEEVIKPALSKKQWVLCDRFVDATVAYQGFARGLEMKLIHVLNEKATQGIRPDMTFLLDCPVEIGLERARRRNKDLDQEDQDRFEREKLDFHRAVQRGYLELAHQDNKRFRIIDATLPEDDVEQAIFDFISPHI